MEIIYGKTANELFINIARIMKLEGKITSPRGLKTIELQNCWLILENPKESIVTLPARKLDMDYLNAEMKWYLSGDLNIEEISKHSSFWKTIANPDGKINSNYGHFVFKQRTPDGLSQYEWCLKKLKEDNNSRQAVINYNQLIHKYESKDFPCTLTQSFRINKGKLDCVVVMRSNDLIYGLSYDLPWFTYIQKRLSEDLGITMGTYNHLALSLHVYEKHFGMLEEIARSLI